MVHEGLLTAHPGSVHGYGWSPGGGVSFRQGGGAASPGSPDLETATAAEQRGFREKGFSIRGFYPRGVNIGEGGSREDPRGSQEASWGGLGCGRARDPPGCLGGPPLPFLVIPEGSLTLIYIIFPEFSEHFK